MKLQGNISDFPMYEVAQLIAMGRKTGKLNLNGEIERLDIYFVDGEAVFARPLSKKDKLGDILVSKGRISVENITNALRLQNLYTERGTNKRLGTILVELGLLPHSALVKFLQNQIEDAIYAILSEDEGTFSFYDEFDLDEEDILVPVNIQKILQESISIVEERKRIKRSIPSISLVCERCKPVEARVNNDLCYLDWKLISLVDGKRTIEEIITASNHPPIDVLKILARLYDQGLISYKADSDS